MKINHIREKRRIRYRLCAAWDARMKSILNLLTGFGTISEIFMERKNSV